MGARQRHLASPSTSQGRVIGCQLTSLGTTAGYQEPGETLEAEEGWQMGQAMSKME